MKLILLGDNNTGKSILFSRLLHIKPDMTEYKKTIAIDFNITHINGEKLCIWDCSGDYIYNSLLFTYITYDKIIVLVYSIDSLKSLGVIKNIYTNYNALDLITNQKIIVVCNKMDVLSDKLLDDFYGEEFATKIGAYFIKVSGKTGENVDKLLEIIMEDDESEEEIIEDNKRKCLIS